MADEPETPEEPTEEEKATVPGQGYIDPAVQPQGAQVGALAPEDLRNVANTNAENQQTDENEEDAPVEGEGAPGIPESVLPESEE